MKCICCPSKHAINHFVISYLSLVNDDIIIVIIIIIHNSQRASMHTYSCSCARTQIIFTIVFCSLRQKFNVNSIRKADRHTFIARLHFIRIKYILFATNYMNAAATLSMLSKFNRLKKYPTNRNCRHCCHCNAFSAYMESKFNYHLVDVRSAFFFITLFSCTKLF